MSNQKFLGCVLLMLAWLLLVEQGKADVQDFINTAKELVFALAAVHLTLINPKGPTP